MLEILYIVRKGIIYIALVILYIVALKSAYSADNRSLYGHVVCWVPVSCKANGVGKELEAWRNSDLLCSSEEIVDPWAKAVVPNTDMIWRLLHEHTRR